ncbi:flagellar filament capping protein FliD [Marinobacterium sediminicola]|uniref:Flagellar hook-associated protein 2 n=1 Tax=Marinobacterium sediminicola TaxID=518898 RepID=A0ABY1RYJ3_9GAMM|nr:flagellar filament capping protein FliD [Marinobacterium sediminicola]ULG68789.1 flagellar filament capping protein FliD [Marinobacterium sediminicola]SMR73318.1 flagellar hook-associated protein 2 [Marinobacterium sediminicola]
MSNIINTLGAGSGIDTTALVSQLVEVERAPQEARLNSREQKLDAQISAYGTLKSALSEFQSLMSPLADNNTFNARSVALPETDVITPNSLAAGAQVGTYQIEVVDIARSQSLAMGSTDDKKAALGASGQMSIQFGEWSYTGVDADIPDNFTINDERAALNIDIDPSDTLETIAKKINDSDSGVQASVLGVDGQYQLMLTAPSGASNAMQITGDDPSLSAFEFNSTNYASVTETQQASDAVLKVNGLSVRRDTNQINDVIEGFDFTLNKSSEGEKLTFAVEADTGVAQQAIRDFVEGYNSLYQTMQNLTGYTRDEDNNLVRGSLSTDGLARSMFSQLRGLIGAEVVGVDSGFTALTNLGIRTQLDGTLEIEEDTFSKAFTENYEFIETLFARDTRSGSNYVDVRLGSYASKTVPGDYEVEITQDPSRGSIGGNAISALNFDAVTDSFTTALDTSVGDYSFKISVDGVQSDTITLSGSYASAEEIRAELQSLINGDSKISEAGAGVDVTYDAATDSFAFNSRTYGKSSSVSFSSASADMANLGISSALSGTAGKDVKGTINGEPGFGTGRVLLPPLGSDAYGMTLNVRPGAASEGVFTASFSQGFAGTMDKLINSILGAEGAIASRETTITDQLEDVSYERSELDRKMSSYEERLTLQYLNMQKIVDSLNSTGSSLDGILDRLPFTAKD